MPGNGRGLRAAERKLGLLGDFGQPGAGGGFGRGLLSGLLGLPGDAQDLAGLGVKQLPVAAQAAMQGLLGGAFGGRELPNSDQTAGLLGADASRPSTQLGMIGAPDPGDLARLGGKGLLAMTLFHGTPHKFDKFDLSKIGTGEGAQAYGHGLYFAESKGVGNQYRMALSPSEVMLDGKPIPSGSKLVATNGTFSTNAFVGAKPKEIAEQLGVSMDEANALSSLGGYDSIDEAIEGARRAAGEGWRGPAGQAGFRKQADILEDMKGRITINDDAGHLYEVDISDETIAKMLDWDAPLSEQPESVRKALKLINKEDISTSRFSINSQDNAIRMTGGDLEVKIFKGENGVIRVESVGERPMTHGRLYRSAVDEKQAIQVAERWMLGDRTTGAGLIELMGKDEAASKALNEAGIPGIRFLDGSSRGKGEGTRNIVVFNPDDIRQAKRDGEIVFENKLGIK